MEKLKLPKLKSVSNDKNFETNEEWVDSVSTKVKKKKIILLSDDLRMSSGVGTMSREFVLGTIEFKWRERLIIQTRIKQLIYVKAHEKKLVLRTHI